jgi:hypothetical protein
MIHEDLSATIQRVTREQAAEDIDMTESAYKGPYWVMVLRANGSVANTGTSFATTAEAYAFVGGLDMAARLFGCRVLLSQSADERASLKG